MQRISTWIAAVLVAVTLLATAPAHLRAADDSALNAPVTIAQSVIGLPGGEAAWGVTEVEVPQEGLEVDSAGGPVFAVADSATLVLAYVRSGERQVLQRGEAAYLLPGDLPTLLPEADGAATALMIGLGPRADSAVGDSFTVPSGSRELELQAGALAAGAHAAVVASDAPVLVAVLDGEVDISEGDRESTLKAGERGVFTGALALNGAAESGSRYLVARIGGEVAETVTSPDSSLVSLAVAGYACESLATPDETCLASGPVDIPRLELVGADGAKWGIDLAQHGEDGLYLWVNLEPGAYLIGFDTIGAPEGMEVRNITGPVEVIEGEGWSISVTDPNQPTTISVFYAPIGSEPAAG